MRPGLLRASGYALITAAVLGLILSLAGLVFLAVSFPRLSANLTGTLSGVSKALTITRDSLDIADTALLDADTALESLTATLDGVTTTLEASDDTFSSLSTLLGTDLPETIQATQASLDSAQVSAKNIDGVLTSLSKIPLLGRIVYNPEVPLNETIGGISDSLDAIPASLTSAKRGIDTVRTNLDDITIHLETISASTDQITASTGEARQVIDDYQTLLDSLQIRIADMQSQLPGQVELAGWIAVIFLLWLALAQLGLLTQGLDLLTRSRKNSQPAGIG